MIPNEFLAYRWLGNPIERWLLAAAFVFVATGVLWGLKVLAVNRLTGFAKRTPTAFDDLLVELLSRTRVLLIFISTMSPATAVLRMPADVRSGLRMASVIALLIQLAIWGNAFISFWLRRYGQRAADTSGAATTALSTIAVIARMVLGLVLILFLLDNLGIDVTALVTGLGISGIIVAL